MKRRVIVVTDGDNIAKQAVEIAAANIGGRCISASSGNPTPLDGYDIIRLIHMAKHDPVVIMIDDRGNIGIGPGEKVLNYMVTDDSIELIGVVAVASNSPKARGVRVDYSIDRYGNLCNKAVDKNGNEKVDRLLKGDTVNSLSDINIPIIIGIGDPGKMDGLDTAAIGAPILTKALQKIIEHNSESSRGEL